MDDEPDNEFTEAERPSTRHRLGQLELIPERVTLLERQMQCVWPLLVCMGLAVGALLGRGCIG
jgi:hypothetical protein